MRTGVEELRLIVRNLNNCRESFLDPFTIEQLLALHRAWMSADWDFPPDQWQPEQVAQALRGITPRWDEDERPEYAPDEGGAR